MTTAALTTAAHAVLRLARRLLTDTTTPRDHTETRDNGIVSSGPVTITGHHNAGRDLHTNN